MVLALFRWRYVTLFLVQIGEERCKVLVKPARLVELDWYIFREDSCQDNCGGSSRCVNACNNDHKGGVLRINGASTILLIDLIKVYYGIYLINNFGFKRISDD